MNEITVRESAIYDELEKLTKEMNKLEQEILSQRSKPVINYTEIVVEIDVEKETDASFFFNYISPKASWKPYYDMRSDGIGKPIKLEAKALVSQNTGIEWKNVDMVLSTNDPYENSKEPIINKSLSGRRGSNSRPRPWEGRALPTELLPLDYPVKQFVYAKLNFDMQI